MKNARFSIPLRAALLLTFLALASFCTQQIAMASPLPFPTGSYIIANTDSTGAFVSRGVITFHADHTLSVIDSGQGGPPSFSAASSAPGASAAWDLSRDERSTSISRQPAIWCASIGPSTWHLPARSRVPLRSTHSRLPRIHSTAPAC
jgi:hypothetical protein